MTAAAGRDRLRGHILFTTGIQESLTPAGHFSHDFSWKLCVSPIME